MDIVKRQICKKKLKYFFKIKNYINFSIIYLNQTDPDGSLSWLVKELFKCEYDGTFAHIMAHIPPSDLECLESWVINYYRIVNRFFF